MNSHEGFINIYQGCFAGTGAIVRLPQCQWSKPDGYGKISQCITTTKHSKAKTVCIFLGIYCIYIYRLLDINFDHLHPTHPIPRNAVVIWKKMQSLKSFYRFILQFQDILLLWMLLSMVNRQAITWPIVDPIPCRNMASLSQNESIIIYIYIIYQHEYRGVKAKDQPVFIFSYYFTW